MRQDQLAQFNADNKDDYVELVAELKQDIADANRILRNCKDIYTKQGHCSKYGTSFWDVGSGYTVPDTQEFEARFTGDWQRDSAAAVDEKDESIIDYLDRQLNGDSFPNLYQLNSDSTYTLQIDSLSH